MEEEAESGGHGDERLLEFGVDDAPDDALDVRAHVSVVVLL